MASIGWSETNFELNGYDSSRVLSSGDALLLPVTDREHQQGFERRREEYHRVLIEEFKENFEVTGTENYTIQPGDNLWCLPESTSYRFG